MLTNQLKLSVEDDFEKFLTVPSLQKDPTQDDLNDLLNESIELKAKATKQKKAAFMQGTFKTEFITGDGWRTTFRCAIFLQHDCTTCGKSQTVFSHYSKFQVHSKTTATQWLKCSKPSTEQIIAVPRIKKQLTAICTSCCSLQQAVTFGMGESTKPQQLLLFKENNYE